MRTLARRMQLNMGFGDGGNDAFAYFCRSLLLNVAFLVDHSII